MDRAGRVAEPNVLVRAVLGVGAFVTLSKTSTLLKRVAEAMILTRVRVRIRIRIRVRVRVYEYQSF